MDEKPMLLSESGEKVLRLLQAGVGPMCAPCIVQRGELTLYEAWKVIRELILHGRAQATYGDCSLCREEVAVMYLKTERRRR